jgi:predicted nuclease of predicted toxin-antitoxin system
MRILANENFPGEAVKALRARGHDVFWARTDSPGSPDSEIVARAAFESRLLITFDKDFGELAFRRGLSSPSGIILFRIKARSPAHITQITVAVLEGRTDWAGHFSVIEEGRVRMTALPDSPPRRV